MEELIERPVSEEQCKKLGGHHWNWHTGNDKVNRFGEYQGVRHNMAFPDGEPQLRTCALCGKRERKEEKWVEVPNE